MICLLKNFRDRKTPIVAYRCALCNQEGSSRVHWILGRFHKIIKGLKKIDEKDIGLLGKLCERQTDYPTNQQTDMRAHKEVALPIKQDLLS